MNYEQSLDVCVSDVAAETPYALPERVGETPYTETPAVCESKERIGRALSRHLLQKHREQGVRY